MEHMQRKLHEESETSHVCNWKHRNYAKLAEEKEGEELTVVVTKSC